MVLARPSESHTWGVRAIATQRLAIAKVERVRLHWPSGGPAYES
jgi:hypothetical protein